MNIQRIDQQAVRIRQLLDENQALRCRIEELEALWLDHVPRFLSFGLTTTERLIFGALMQRDLVSKEQLMTLAYGLRADAPQEKIIDVMVCRLRKKMAHLGVVIDTVWGAGYRLPASSKTKVAELLQHEQASIKDMRWTPPGTDTGTQLPTSST